MASTECLFTPSPYVDLENTPDNICGLESAVKSPTAQPQQVWLHLFTSDIRISYNQTLIDAINQANGIGMPMLFAYVLDDTKWKFSVNRENFIYEAVKELDEKLDGKLLWFKDTKIDAIKKLMSSPEFSIQAVSFEKPVMNWYLSDTTEIVESLYKHGIKTFEYEGSTIFSSEVIAKIAGDDEPLTLERFLNIVSKVNLNDVCNPTSLSWQEIVSSINFAKFKVSTKYLCPERADFLGVNVMDIPESIYIGGENEGRRRLDAFNMDMHVAKELLDPTSWFTNNKSCVAPYLANGCISVKHFFQKFVEHFGGEQNKEEILRCNIITRDYYNVLNIRNDFLTAWQEPLYEIMNHPDSMLRLEAFNSGRTGFPFIDAALRQCIMEGWSANLVRAAIVTFLTTSGLMMPWEHGVEFFASHILDFDYIVCVGCWNKYSYENPMFIDFVQYGKSMDPQGLLIREFVPELALMPEEFVHEPWNAPIEVQKKANCIVGTDYRERLFDNTTQYLENRERYMKCIGPYRKPNY